MARSNSFDIVSETNLEEVRNAVHMAMKEVRQRFDFKGSVSEITLGDGELVLVSDDEYRLQALTGVLEQKLVRRGVSLKALTAGKIEAAAGGTVRQQLAIQQGIPAEKAKEIARFIRGLGIRVQAAIQGDSLRVSGKKRDELQETIRAVKEHDFGIEMQFTNYRS